MNVFFKEYKEIEESDGLSHKVCVKCLGALEFLCDFHDQCHKTQRRLEKEIECKPSSNDQPEDDGADSDKENISPLAKTGVKKRKKTSEETSEFEKMSKFQETQTNVHELKKRQVEAGKVQSPIQVPENNITEILKERDQGRQENSRLKDNSNNDKLVNISEKKSKKPQKSHLIATIVKTENYESNVTDGCLAKENPLTINKLVWIPEMLQLPGESPKSVRIEKPKGGSPPAGDEAEEERNEKNVEQNEETASMGASRKSVETPKDEDVPQRRSRPVRKSSKIHESYDEDSDSSDESEDESIGKKKFSKITDLITEEQKEAIEKFYVCDMSAVNEKLVSEKLIILDRKKFGCALCDAVYARMDKCQVHIWGHLEMKPYRCTACDFSTVTVSNIRCHVRKSHLKIKPYACELCEKRYVTAFLLEEHMNTHTGSRPYGCDVCNFTSASRQVLSYHKTTHKPVKDITCNVCGKEFYSKGRLRAHLIVHNKDRAASMCKYCSIYLCSSEALQKHYANVHNKDYECNVCGKRCKSKKALNNHLNVHSAAKYKCTLCSNVYKSSHILKEHLLKHEGIRKYKCTVCEKDFAQQSHLAAHMAVHSDKRFLCPGCKRAFNRHDNMKMHTKRCELFLANPELAKLLSIRKRQSRSLPDKAEERERETQLAKTDINVNKERRVEMPNVTSTVDNSREKFSTVIIENTIACT